MRAVIMDTETYDGLPSTLCDAIWETFQKSYGAILISREDGGIIDRITMTGILHTAIEAKLREVGDQ